MRRYLSTIIFNLHVIIININMAETIFQSQSTSCTDADNMQRIQCIRELPLALYEVFEGDDVLMKCRIAYQRGKLQWAFKGKMLGFDRDIPNYPRMRMPGNSEIGDHSLFIENVKVSDSGNYECQLSPAASQPPRRRMTNLIVLKPPTNPRIYQDTELLNGKISVSLNKDANDFRINVTCVSTGGNPKPTFLWTINDRRLNSDWRSAVTPTTMVNESTSLVTLQGDQLQNNDVISCAVSNTATMKRANVSERILVTKVLVVKQILPGPLRFKQIPTDVAAITVLENDQFRLACMTTDPGDPPVSLTWTTSLGNYPINDQVVSNVNNKIFSESALVIPSIDSKWHRATVSCGGTQNGYPATKKIFITILVKYFPKKVEMSVVSVLTNDVVRNPTTVYCDQNRKINIECISDSYYSMDLRMIWLAKVTDNGSWENIRSSVESFKELEGGKLRSLKSILEISPNLIIKQTSKMSVVVACIMKSRDTGAMLRKEVKLETYVQSSSPLISINDERKSTILANGQRARIKCSVIGGNPTPQLYLLDENEHQIEGRTFFKGEETILEVIIDVKSQDQGRKLRCTTLSKVTLDYVSLSSGQITLTVAMPPTRLTMVSHETGAMFRAFQYISLRCFTDLSFPESIIEWRWYHSCRKQTYPLSTSNIRQLCDSDLIENNITNFNSSTQSTMSTINVKLLPSHDHTFIECRVLPHDKWTQFIGELSKVTNLLVQYLPLLPRELEKMYIVEEGQNISININAKANPPINGYSWLVNKQTVTTKSQIQLKVDQLSVANAQLDMMGNYTLLLENRLGKNGFSFFLNVTFPPKLLGPLIETVKLNPVTEYKQKSVILCSAQANPFKEQATVQWTRDQPMVMDHNDLLDILHGNGLFLESPQVHCAKDHWTRDNVSINCISLGAIEIVSSLQIMPKDHRYIGSYKCTFSNTIKASSAIKTTHLVFPTAPVPIRNRRKSQYATKIGGKTEIVCYFVAYPSPTVVWSRSVNIQCADNAQKYATSISNIQTGLFKAVLAIRDTNESDITTYYCSAHNQYGRSSHFVTLRLPGNPGPLMNVTVVNRTDTSITFGWILSFNGGSKQTIEVRWRLVDIGREIDSNVIEIEENELNDVQFYTIKDLQSDREYEVSIQSTNQYTVNANHPMQIFVKTIKSETETERIQSDSRRGIVGDSKDRRIHNKTSSNNILIIILLSIIGGVLIGFKIGLVVYYFRKRNHKFRISLSPGRRRSKDGYQNSRDSIELRAPSVIRSGHESTMYTQSMSDHMSQNGSENGLRYKQPFENFPEPYHNPELDFLTSSMGRNSVSTSGGPSNCYPTYARVLESVSLNRYHDPYLTRYYSARPEHQIGTRNNSLPIQHPSMSLHQRFVDGNNYPTSVQSMSTASGGSNRSLSSIRKFPRYSPMIGQSGAPSTVEEYLSSTHSGSGYKRSDGSNGNEEYSVNQLNSFRLKPKTSRSNSTQDQVLVQEHLITENPHFNGADYRYLPMNGSQYQHINPDSEAYNFFNRDACPQTINYVELNSHQSPSVIRINGIISENL